MTKLLVLSLIAAATLAAQDGVSAASGNQKAVDRAVAGIKVRLARKAVMEKPRLVARQDLHPGACAAMLTEIPLERPERFSVRAVPLAPTAPMPNIVTPLPPCKPSAN